MDWWSLLMDVVRIVVSVAVSAGIGWLYYWPDVNPIARVWINETFPGAESVVVASPTVRVHVACTLAGYLLLAYLVNLYVRKGNVGMVRLAQMSVELWLMCGCLHLPHVLFSGASTKAFAVDQAHSLLVVFAQALTLGLRRRPPKTHLD